MSRLMLAHPPCICVLNPDVPIVTAGLLEAKETTLPFDL